jgi:GMP synthase (glutamine-hydrolysing)
MPDPDPGPETVIVKLGSAPESIRARRDDFEHWVARGMAMPFERCLIVDPRLPDPLPDPRTCNGVVLTGSDAMLTDNPDWSLRTEAWLTRVLDAEVPVLGICYGHQLLAHALGGEVGWSPQGEEIGTVEVHLTLEGRNDPLLTGLPHTLTVQSSHSQSVVKPPAGVRILACNAHDAVQGLAFGSHAWGFQFHPEFDADISRGYIEDDRDKLAAEGRDPVALLNATRDADHGTTLLRRFAERLRR